MIALIVGVPIWLFAMLLRFALMVVGVFFIPLTLLADGARATPRLWRPVFGNVEDAPVEYRASRWKSYVWMAWRNPVEGLDKTFKQPIPEAHPNPDGNVRGGDMSSDSRFMQSGIFWEYWYLKAVKGGKFFEFRIGWKFVDGNEDFVPTVQIGIKR